MDILDIIDYMSTEERCIDDYELLCVIGKGSFGKIFLVKELETGKVYAMKVVKKKMIEKQNKLKYIFTERDMLVDVPLLLDRFTTPMSLGSSVPSRTSPSSTSSFSTVLEASSTTSLPSRKSSLKNSTPT